jgi:hypothetical protein
MDAFFNYAVVDTDSMGLFEEIRERLTIPTDKNLICCWQARLPGIIRGGQARLPGIIRGGQVFSAYVAKRWQYKFNLVPACLA